MPAVPPELGEWFSPGIIAAAGALLLNQLMNRIGKRIDSLEATTNRRFDEQDKKLDDLRKLMELLSKTPR